MSDSTQNPHQKLATIVKDIQYEVIENNTTKSVDLAGVRRYDVLVGKLVDVLLMDFELEISHSTAEDRVNDTLSKMIQESENGGYDDPVSCFRSEWPEISGSKSASKFEVFVPIPVMDQENSLPGKIKYGAHTFERIASKTWKHYEQEARTTDAEDSEGYPPNLEVLSRNPESDDVLTSEYTFWKFDALGTDADYVVQQMESVLDVFLGQLSFVADNTVTLRLNQSADRVKKSTRTVFQTPPFYLIYRDSTLHRIHPSKSPVQGPVPRLRSGFSFEEKMKMFPSLAEFEELVSSIYQEEQSVHVRAVEAQLGAAFRTLGRALRETDPESMFLSLYRTLEHITFTKYAESKEPLNRALQLLNLDTDDRLDDLATIVKNRRNTIVHDGTDVEVTQTDINFLKSLSINTLEEVGKLSQLHDTDEIISLLYLSDITSKIGTIENSVEQKDAEISMMQEELQVLENIQNQID